MGWGFGDVVFEVSTQCLSSFYADSTVNLVPFRRHGLPETLRTNHVNVLLMTWADAWTW